MLKTPALQPLLKKTRFYSFLISAIGAMATFVYLNVIDPPPLAQEALSKVDWLYLLLFIVILGLTLVLGSALGKKIISPITAWDQHIERGNTQEIPNAARSMVLNYPLYATAITALMWLISGSVFALINLSWRIFIGIVGVGGVISTVLSYFTIELLWRPIIPRFFPQGDLSTVHAFRLSVFGRLLIAFLLIGIIPPWLLVNLSWQRAQSLLSASNPLAILNNLRLLQNFILAFSLLASVGLAFLITRGITTPLRQLQTAMEQVKKNDFNAHVAVVTNDELGYLGERFNQMTAGLRQGEMLRNILNVYVSPEVAREALEHGTHLGGELVESSILFSDIRGFTGIAEKLPPNELVALLNRYMSMMVDVIVANGGMVNKFGGDSLLALFGTPLNPQADHAQQAVLSAKAMFRALDRFNKEQLAKNMPDLQIGIGIATGTVVAGNIGGRERIEYTVIGDTVNLAARLEEKTKEIAENLLISAETYEQATRELPLRARRLADINLKGKLNRVVAYALE
jgi:adenylate cyclase